MTVSGSFRSALQTADYLALVKSPAARDRWANMADSIRGLPNSSIPRLLTAAAP